MVPPKRPSDVQGDDESDVPRHDPRQRVPMARQAVGFEYLVCRFLYVCSFSVKYVGMFYVQYITT